LLQHQKRILIIDDDPDISISLQAVLAKYGFRVDYYTNPVLACNNFRSAQDARIRWISFVSKDKKER